MSTKKLARELGIIRKRRENKDPGQTKRPGSKQYFSYLIIIDFESTCWREKNNYGQEIIEFPAVLMNTSTGEVESEFHTYVQPQEHPILSEFCTELTGITQAQVEAGVPLAICMSRFSRWLQALQQERGVAFLRGGKAPLATGSPCAFVTWSDWDLGVCLLYECKRKQICKPEALNSWIDLRATYKLFYSRKPKGLNGGLQDLGIEFSGREHSGLDDARNTARLAWRMITDGCFMKITKSLDRAPLRAKPMFPNAQKSPSDQQGPASDTKSQDGRAARLLQSTDKATTDAAVAHTTHDKHDQNPHITSTRNDNALPTSTTNYPLTTTTTTIANPATISISNNLPSAIATNNHLPTATTSLPNNNPLTTTTSCQYQSLVTPRTVLNGSSNPRHHLYVASGGLIGSLTRQYSSAVNSRVHASRPLGPTDTTTTSTTSNSPSPWAGSDRTCAASDRSWASSDRTWAGSATGLVLVSTAVGSHCDLQPKQLNFDLEASSSSSSDADEWTDGVLLPETEESGSYDDVVLEEEEKEHRDISYNNISYYGNNSRQMTAGHSVSRSTLGTFTTSSRVYSTLGSLQETVTKPASTNTTPANQQQPASDDACFKKPRPVSAPTPGDVRPLIHRASCSPAGLSIPVTPSYSNRNPSLCKTTIPSSVCMNSSRQMPTICNVSATNSGPPQTLSDKSASHHLLHSIATPHSSITTNSKIRISGASASNHSLELSAHSSVSATKRSLVNSNNSLLQQSSNTLRGPNGLRQHALELKTPTSSRSFTVYQDIKCQPSTSSTSSKWASMGGAGSFSVPSTVLSARVNGQSQRGGRAVNQSMTRAGLLASAAKVTSPLCNCGRRAKRQTVGNGGPNHGRSFYCCPVRRSGSGPGSDASGKKNKQGGCGFFKWESALLVSVTPGVTKKKSCPNSGVVAREGTPHLLSGKQLR